MIYELVKKYNVPKALFITYHALFFAAVYFIFSTIFGPKGMMEYFSLRNEISSHEVVKNKLANELKTKKTMVEGMNVESLDLDLLDEEARRSLGYANKNEVVVYQKSNETKAKK